MLTLFNSLIHYERIDECVYQELSRASLDSMLHSEFSATVNDLEILYKFPEEYTMLGGGSLPNDFLNLNGLEAEKELKKFKGKKVDCILGYIDTFEYTPKLLDILNILNNQGYALVLIPALKYQQVKGDLKERGFFVNAIFSSDDSRNSTNLEDLSRVIPVHCKYLGLAISRKEFDCLYVHTEGSFDYDLDLYRLKDGVKPTNKNKVYGDILNQKCVYVADKDFISLNHFYMTSQANAELEQYQNLQEYKLGEIANSINGFYWSLPKLLRVLEDYEVTNKGKCLKYVNELLESVKNSLDSEREYFNLDEEGVKKYEELHTALDQLWNQLITVDTLEIPEFFNQFDAWIEINTYLHQYKPNEIDIQLFKNISKSNFNEDILYSDDSHHSENTVSIDNSVILIEYLELYLSTKLGKLNVGLAILESNKKDIKDAWKNIKILTPSIDGQRIVVSALNKINKLECEIDSHKDGLVGNPFNAGGINLDLREWLLRLDKLNTSEDSLYLINKGESDTIEFKETLSFSIKAEQQTKKTRETIESVVAKTVVGFLNKRGGTLFIGVSDDGVAIGLERDLEYFYQSNIDRLLLKLREIFENKIGNQYLSFWKYEAININSKNIIRIDCIPTLDPCFYEANQFLVRTNPATIELKGSDMLNYMKTRFKE